jgi:secreted trypsin-like serine protease
MINNDFLAGYDGSMDTDSISWNDIALLRLSKEAPSAFQFAKLATTSDLDTIEATTAAILSGYGVATPIVNKVVIDPKTKQPVLVPVPEKIQTSGILRKVENQNIVKLVADAGKDIVFDQSKDTGSCHGDSGGPAFIMQADGTLLQIGVASRVTEKIGNCIERGVFTNVAAQRTWIDSALEAILKPNP